MKEPHCMTCGGELRCLNYTVNNTKYICDSCDKHWFKTTHTIVEWTSRKVQKEESEQGCPHCGSKGIHYCSKGRVRG